MGMQAGGVRKIVVPPRGISAEEWKKFLGSNWGTEKNKSTKEFLNMIAATETHISK